MCKNRKIKDENGKEIAFKINMPSAQWSSPRVSLDVERFITLLPYPIRRKIGHRALIQKQSEREVQLAEKKSNDNILMQDPGRNMV